MVIAIASGCDYGDTSIFDDFGERLTDGGAPDSAPPVDPSDDPLDSSSAASEDDAGVPTRKRDTECECCQ